MSPKSWPVESFRKDERGIGLVDSPFMIILSVLLVAFVTVFGLYLATNLAEAQTLAVAVDSAEKIYYAADLLSAGAPHSTRTLWVKIPPGYYIRLAENVTLGDKNGAVGVPLHINGVRIQGDDLTVDGKHHLRLECRLMDGKTVIQVTEI